MNVAVQTINEVLKENPELSVFGKPSASLDSPIDSLSSDREFLINEIEGSLIEANNSYYGSRETYRNTLYDISINPPVKNSFLPNQTYENFIQALRRSEQRLDLLTSEGEVRSAYISVPIKVYKKEHEKLRTLLDLIESQTSAEEKSSEHILIQVLGELLLMPDTWAVKLKLNKRIEKYPLPICEWLLERLKNRVQIFSQAEHDLLENIFDSLISTNYYSIEFGLHLDDLLQYTDLTKSYRALSSLHNAIYVGPNSDVTSEFLEKNSKLIGLIEALQNIRINLVKYNDTPHLNQFYKTDATRRTSEHDHLEYRENEKSLNIMRDKIKTSVDDLLHEYKKIWLLDGIPGFVS